MNINSKIDSFSRSLGAYSLKNKAITNNIANAETPNYKRQDVKFEEFLKKNEENYRTFDGYVTSDKHIKINEGENSTPETYTVKNTSSRLDGNNVDIDVENAELSKNYIKFMVESQQLSSYFRRIKSALSEGRR